MWVVRGGLPPPLSTGKPRCPNDTALMVKYIIKFHIFKITNPNIDKQINETRYEIAQGYPKDQITFSFKMRS